MGPAGNLVLTVVPVLFCFRMERTEEKWVQIQNSCLFVEALFFVRVSNERKEGKWFPWRN